MTIIRCWTAVVLLLGLAACVSTSEDSGPKPPAAGTVSESARIHTQLAASYFEIGNMAIALEEVKAALSADPNYGPAYNVAGLIYGQLKEDRLAEQNFQRSLAINPGDSDALNNYGRFLCSRGQVEQGIKQLMSAVRNPFYTSVEGAYVNAGICARGVGQSERAEEFFQAALKTRPSQPQALYQLADMAYARGDLLAARGHLGRLAQTGVLTADVLWLGTRVERKLGDRNAEASYARQLRNRYPNSAEARALNAGKFE